MNELRLGHSNMPIAKDKGAMKQTPVSKYGLSGRHHILLEGSTFPPEKRGSMAQSLGPMTALLCHIRSDEKYRLKWTQASKRALSHIPFIDEVLEATKGKKASEIHSLIKVVADIACTVTARQAHRMFFPLNMFVKIYEASKASGEIIGESGQTYTAGEELLKHFNVSGIGGFYFYKIISDMKWDMEGEINDVQASQILFHTIFGTYKEDLSILEAITNLGTWNTREEFGKCFQGMKTSGKIVSFSPVKLSAYSKLCSANQTQYYSSTYTQVCCAPVFSGHRIQHFSEEFFQQMSESTGRTTSAKTTPQLVSALSDELTLIIENLRSKGGRLEMGTLEWRKMETLTLKEHGEAVTDVAQGTGKFFLGSRK